MSGGSDIRFSLNLSILVLEKILVKGLSFMERVSVSMKVKLGRWSERSAIKLPEEHLF